MIKVLIILCGFALHQGIQSPRTWTRRTSTGVLFMLLAVFASAWAGTELFKAFKEIIQ